MLRLKRKEALKPNYDKKFTGDHKADNLLMLGCIMIGIIIIGFIVYFLFI